MIGANKPFKSPFYTLGCREGVKINKILKSELLIQSMIKDWLTG